MYDVIIIGAGPAGSTAAKVLAEKGRKVLLVERCKLPRYKSCSGVLIKKSMDLVKLYFGEAVPVSVMCTPTENRGMIFTDDKGKEFLFEQEGLNVWRSTFDNWLAVKAAEKGAEVRDCTTALSCEESNGLVTVVLRGKDTYTEEAKYVLDCEGVTGTLKRKIVKSTPQYITTFQAFNEGYIDLDYHYFYAYLQPELSEYDAWFNVKGNLLVLGVSVKDTSKIEYFYNRFITYMKDNHHLRIDKQVKAEKWLMPHIRPGCHIDYGVGRVLFAGEIAGFLNPMGEGISAGMETGY
ncbi:MAG: fumarate reductase, partial [Neobacillus sp.]|nr:fumarate reductase [Neobacillus sp.]